MLTFFNVWILLNPIRTVDTGTIKLRFDVDNNVSVAVYMDALVLSKSSDQVCGDGHTIVW